MMEDMIRAIVAEELSKQLRPLLDKIGEVQTPTGIAKVMTRSQLADTLNISTRTLSRIDKSGKLDEAHVEIGPRRIGYNYDKVLQILG